MKVTVFSVRAGLSLRRGRLRKPHLRLLTTPRLRRSTSRTHRSVCATGRSSYRLAFLSTNKAFDVRYPPFNVPFDVVMPSSSLACPCNRMLQASPSLPPSPSRFKHRRTLRIVDRASVPATAVSQRSRHCRRRSSPPFNRAYWERLLQPLTAYSSH